MNLLPNWKLVLTRSWSVWLILLSGILSGIEVVLPLLPDSVEFPSGMFAALSMTVAGLAAVFRILVQKNLQPTAVIVAVEETGNVPESE